MASQIPQDLEYLFSWNPPKLIPRPLPGKKLSTKSHSPTFFDRHFHEALQLLYVKRLPTLVRDITAIVDASITDGVQFPSGTLFPKGSINTLVRLAGTELSNEKAVASFYERTTATICIAPASVLALRVPFLLKWTQSANVSGYAIADGFIHFVSAGDSSDILELMGEETEHIRALADKVSSLATFEFKNMAAGGPEVMLAIPRLTTLPKFEWTTCNNPGCTIMSTHQRERDKVAETEVRIGFDATTTPWTLPSNNLVSPDVQDGLEYVGTGLKRKREEEIGDQTMEQTSNSLGTQSLKTPQGPEPLGISKTSKRTRCSEPRRSSRLLAKATPVSIPPPVGVQVEAAVSRERGTQKGKTSRESGTREGKGKEGQGGDVDDVNDPSYRDNHDLSALYMVQQAWAQATRADSSIIVLQSGNHEFIGIRHRRTRTLYISDLIEPHACQEPAYGKLHVGLYMAAVRDAIDRERQRAAGNVDGGGPSDDPSSSGRGDSSGGGPSGDPSSGGRGYNGGSSGAPGQGGNEMPKEGGSTEGNDTIAAHEIAARETWEAASRRNVVLVYLQYGIYDSPAPSTFVRSGPTGQAPIALPSWKIVRNYKLEECLTIVLESEIGHGSTGDVLRGRLMVEMSACIQLDVAVKLAFAREQRDAIRNEYKMYHLLRERGVTTGITMPLGLFDEVEDAACALVMPYLGIPLSEKLEIDLPISSWDGLLANLKKIHQANILHDDLRLDNILVADSGLTIIDFALSRVCYDQGAKDREYSQLQSLLRDVQSRVTDIN